MPLMKVGKMTLNKAPEDYYEEVEKVAFSPANIVPGIEFSFDRLLQGSIFASLEANRHRLGSDFDEITVNQTKYAVNYAAVHQRGEPYPPLEIEGSVDRKGTPKGDNFIQAGERYRSLTLKEKDRLVDNIIDHLMFVDDDIQEKVVGYFTQADQDFGARISRGLDF